MSKEEGDIPEEKKTKGLTKMFKSIKDAYHSASPLGGVFNALTLLGPLLKPLEIIMRIVGSLFAVMAAEILPPLLDALEPVFDMLMGMQPLFQEIGVYIGELVTAFLPPLIGYFIDLMVVIKPLIPRIMDLVAQLIEFAVKALPIIIEVVIQVVEIFLGVLKPILDWLSGLSATELGRVVYAFGLGLSAIWGFMHMGGPWGAALGAAIWAGVMTPLLSLQEGAILTRPVVAEVGHGEGEIVAPLGPFNRRLDAMVSAQEETNFYLKEIYEEKKFRHTLEGF